jgi:hypothetical protein
MDHLLEGDEVRFQPAQLAVYQFDPPWIALLVPDVERKHANSHCPFPASCIEGTTWDVTPSRPHQFKAKWPA